MRMLYLFNQIKLVSCLRKLLEEFLKKDGNCCESRYNISYKAHDMSHFPEEFRKDIEISPF